MEGLANAQTGGTTKSTMGYSSNQTPGAVTNRGQVNPDNQGGSGSNNKVIECISYFNRANLSKGTYSRL